MLCESGLVCVGARVSGLRLLSVPFQRFVVFFGIPLAKVPRGEVSHCNGAQPPLNLTVHHDLVGERGQLVLRKPDGQLLDYALFHAFDQRRRPRDDDVRQQQRVDLFWRYVVAAAAVGIVASGGVHVACAQPVHVGGGVGLH